MCVCVCEHVCDLVCMCFAMLCIKMFVNFCRFCLQVYMPLIFIIMGICALYFFFKLQSALSLRKLSVSSPLLLYIL